MDETRKVSLLSININGNLSIIENASCVAYINDFDIVALSELKSSYVFSVPGYTVLRSCDRGLRGGVGVLVKHKLMSSVFDVQLLSDQVWFRLSFMSDVKFCACYVPPADSPYFNPTSFSDIQSQVVGSESKIVLIGDINSRMGNLNRLDAFERGIVYASNVDATENAHGRNMLRLCNNLDMYPVNHLTFWGKSFVGRKTFRKRERWISQLDWLFCSSQLLHLIHKFDVVQNVPFKSDHAALTVTIECPPPPTECILERAKLLGEYPCGAAQDISRKAIKFSNVNVDSVVAALPDPVPWWHRCENLLINEEHPAMELSKWITDEIYNACKNGQRDNLRPSVNDTPNIVDANSRWQALLARKDLKLVWSSINWKGEFEVESSEKNKPTNEAFRGHFQKLLNPAAGYADIAVPDTYMYVPLLDDPITPREVEVVIKKLHNNKSAGVDGVPPGAFKMLGGEWLFILTYLFNLVFSGEYPPEWSYTKMFTIFKKGRPEDVNNYRGISVQGALTKIYEGVLNNRFTSWFIPDEEQAGGCTGRGCAEQLFTLRLLIEYARKTKQTLYIAYIDYVKAYDKVNRNILLRKLADHGCGQRYLQAIANSLKETTNVLGDVCFKSSSGVKQGAANSSSLFTFYINSTIRALKNGGSDGYLENLHCLLFMDDTAILATSRDALQSKLSCLIEEAKHIDMEIHPEKSKFMTINTEDREPFCFDRITIGHVNKYMYLGSQIMNARIPDQVKANVDIKQNHLMKFSSFLKKNSEAPFSVKNLVFKSALSSAVLYGCESWLCNDLQAAASSILSAQKQLLSVRSQTCNDLVQAELACPDGKTVIRELQTSFLKKLMARSDFVGSPAHSALRLNRQAGTAASSYIDNLVAATPDSLRKASLQSVQERIRGSESSRKKAYTEFNKEFTLHPVYTRNVPEWARIAFTRMRLGSHRLRVETGRWSRIPREERICPCRSAVQTEAHVLVQCPMTEPLRGNFPMLKFDDVFSLMESSPGDLVRYCHGVLKVYEDG